MPGFGGKFTVGYARGVGVRCAECQYSDGTASDVAASARSPFLGLKRIDPRFGTPAIAIALAAWSGAIGFAGDHGAHYHPESEKRLYKC